MMCEPSVKVAVVYGTDCMGTYLLEQIYNRYSSDLLEYQYNGIAPVVPWYERHQQFQKLTISMNLFGEKSSINFDRKHFVFYKNHDIDTFAHRNKYINAILYCDFVLFVVNVRQYFDKKDDLTPYYFRTFLLFKKLNVTQLLIACDEIIEGKSVADQNALFEKIKQLTIRQFKLIGYVPVKLKFVPISVVSGTNLFSRETASQETLLEGLTSFVRIKFPEYMNVRLLKTPQISESELVYGTLDERAHQLFAIDENQLYFVDYKKVCEGIEPHRTMYENRRLILVAQPDFLSLSSSVELVVEVIIFPGTKIYLETNTMYDFEGFFGSFHGIFKKFERVFTVINDISIYTTGNVLYEGEYGNAILRMPRGIHFELFTEYPILGVFFLNHGLHDLLVFVRNRNCPNRFDEEKKRFLLCQTSNSVELLNKIETPFLEHILIALANNNAIAFETLTKTYLRRNYESNNMLAIHKLLCLVPYERRDRCLCLMLEMAEFAQPDGEQTIRECLFGHFSLRVMFYKSICVQMGQNERAYQHLISDVVYREQIQTIDERLVDFRSDTGPIRWLASVVHRRSPLIKQFMDPANQLRLIDVCESCLNPNFEKNELFWSIIRADDAAMLSQLMDIRDFAGGRLAESARIHGKRQVLRYLLNLDPSNYLRSSKSSKYLKFVKSKYLIYHYENFKMNIKKELRKMTNIQNILNIINRFCLCILYHDPKYVWKNDQVIRQAKRDFRNYPQVCQAFDGFANFLEAEFYRNNNAGHERESSQTLYQNAKLLSKYHKLNVKVCSNADCKVTFLQILHEMNPMRLARMCFFHARDNVEIETIANLIGNRYSAVYVYFFYQVFIVGVEIMRKKDKNPYLLYDLDQSIDFEILRDILFRGNAEDFLLF